MSPRRSREEAAAEILEAAEAFLVERPLRDLSVARLMAQTSLGRSSFYVYFQDRQALVKQLLDRREAQLMQASRPWLAGEGATVRDGLRGVVQVWAAHGPVLRAIVEASFVEEEVESAWTALMDRFVEAVSARIVEEQREGLVAGDLEPEHLARALLRMNERYLMDALGRRPQADVDTVLTTLAAIWEGALYGR